MARALELAAKARGETSPNPMVGCVIVREGRIIGEGYHTRAGKPHAEIEALAACREDPKGGTMYVTLEPCCVQGRTPPCVPAVIRAGIARVVCAIQDPNPRVDGQGFAQLRAAGIQVDVGCESERATRLNAAYLKSIRTGLPLVVIKGAMSLDGKIATHRRQAEWLSGPEARAMVHRWRSEVDALMVGIGTIIADDPRLDTRLADRRDARSPVTVILDSRLRTPPTARTLDPSLNKKTLIYCLAPPDRDRAAALAAAGAEIVPTAPGPGGIDLELVLRDLVRRGLINVLCEGGGTVNATLVAQGLADRIKVFIAPRLIGGRTAPSLIDGRGVTRVHQGAAIGNLTVKRVGSDLLLEGDIVPPADPEHDETSNSAPRENRP